MSQILEHIFAHSVPEPNTGCWLYLQFCNPSGYGRVVARGKQRLAHRVVLMETQTGWDIGEDVLALHRCDQPSCVNPDHIYPGNQQRNALDSVERRRHHCATKTHCKNGHAFSAENTILNRGKRSCKACRKMNPERKSAYQVEYHKKNREKHLAYHRAWYMAHREAQIQKARDARRRAREAACQPD